MLLGGSLLTRLGEIAAVVGILAGIGLNLFTMVKYTNGKGAEEYF